MFIKCDCLELTCDKKIVIRHVGPDHYQIKASLFHEPVIILSVTGESLFDFALSIINSLREAEFFSNERKERPDAILGSGKELTDAYENKATG